MKTAVVYYNSKTGTTKYFGEEIAKFLMANNINPTVYSIFDAKPEQVAETDFVLLGCWTSGLFIAFQHPDKNWVEFAKKLPDLKGRKVALFTTYKLATGSMFGKMTKQLIGKTDQVQLLLKAKSYKLTEKHKSQLLSYIA